jgi:hypothetical protein
MLNAIYTSSLLLGATDLLIGVALPIAVLGRVIR